MRNRLLISVLFLLVNLFFVIPELSAQTCSCAATPLFNPLDFSTLNNRKWHFELSFKYHAMNDLVEGAKKVEDDTERRRTAQFMLFDARYALRSNLTIRAVFSVARQYREIGISQAGPVSTRGIGDGMLILQYSPFPYSETNKTEVSLGAGVKIPLGENNAQVEVRASEDMQPGTGSWDFLGWGFVSRQIPLWRWSELFIGLSARVNGEDSRGYSFGSEVTASLGARTKAVRNLLISVYARYRWAGSDHRFDAPIPNTGGHWVYVVPSISLNLTKDMGFKTEVELPVYRNLSGYRQFTSTYLVSVSLFYQY